MKELRNKGLLVPWIVAVVGSVVSCVSIFLPYASAKDADVAQGVASLTGFNAANPSMVDFAKVYFDMSGQYISELQANITVGVTAIIGVCALLALLFGVLKKPVAVIVFDVLILLAFLMQNFDFSDRGVVPSDNYSWGIGYYLLFLGVIATFVGAVWFAVIRRRTR